MIKMTYDKITFAFATDLPDDIRKHTDIKTGLVAVKIKGDKYDIDKIEGSPTDYIKGLAKEENIDMEKVFSRFKDD